MDNSNNLLRRNFEPFPDPVSGAVVHGVVKSLLVAGPVPGHPGTSVSVVDVQVVRLAPHTSNVSLSYGVRNQNLNKLFCLIMRGEFDFQT